MSNNHSIFDRARWTARSITSHRWLALGVASAVAAAAAVAISFVPQRYEASAKVYVDTQTVLKPMMVGLTYQPDIEQQVRMLARTLISRPNVEKLLDRPEVKFDVSSQRERDQTVSRLMDQIRIVAAERGNLFTISYRDTSPERALKLVESTLTLFVNTGSSGKKQDSEDARRFIDAQLRENEAKLIEAEGRLKDFKVRNFGVTGVSNQDYFGRMSTLSDEVNKLRSDLSAAERAREAYRRELAAEDPQLPAESFPAAAPATLEIDNRIDSQRKQLDDLLRRYTEDHPDVVAARRVVATLEAQRRRELDTRARSGARSNGTAATSPVYQRLRIALAESEAQVASIRSQLSAQAARLEQTRAMAGRLPQVEAEFVQLNRDYDVIRKNYEQLVGRRESATLAVKLDESSQLTDFRAVEPPRVSPTPVFPGRTHLALIAVLLSTACGLAAAVAIDLLRPTFTDGESLQQLTGRPSLSSISISKTVASQAAARRDALRFVAVTTLLMAVQLSWLGWMVLRPVAV